MRTAHIYIIRSYMLEQLITIGRIHPKAKAPDILLLPSGLLTTKIHIYVEYAKKLRQVLEYKLS